MPLNPVHTLPALIWSAEDKLKVILNLVFDDNPFQNVEPDSQVAQQAATAAQRLLNNLDNVITNLRSKSSRGPVPATDLN
jgi:hypothetical protein